MGDHIIQLERQPVEERLGLTADDLPDWFFPEITDYVLNIEDADQVDYVRQYFITGCCDEALSHDDIVVITKESVRKWFKEKHEMFSKALLEYEDFARVAKTYDEIVEDLAQGGKAKDLAWSLNRAVNNRFGTYVYGPGGVLQTLDAFLRNLDLDEPATFYFGGVVYYH